MWGDGGEFIYSATCGRLKGVATFAGDLPAELKHKITCPFQSSREETTYAIKSPCSNQRAGSTMRVSRIFLAEIRYQFRPLYDRLARW